MKQVFLITYLIVFALQASGNDSLCANPAIYFRNKYNGQYIAEKRARIYRSLDQGKLDRSIKKATRRLIAREGAKDLLDDLDKKSPPCGKLVNCSDPESIVRYSLLSKVDPQYVSLRDKTVSPEFDTLRNLIGRTLSEMPEFSTGLTNFSLNDPNKKIQTEFLLAKKSFKSFLDESILDKPEREKFQSDIENTTIQVKDVQDIDGELFGYESADFDPVKNKISIGFRHTAISDSHISTMGHELGHRIDPCYESHQRFMTKGEISLVVPLTGSKYPFKEVIKCLRSAESIFAMPVDPSGPDVLCVPFQDRINEAFCDWAGVETMVKAVIENPKLSTSEKKAIIEEELVFGATRDDKFFKGTARDVHPSFEDRINKIFFAHPKVRELFACAPNQGAKYCEPPRRFTQPTKLGPKPNPNEAGTK